jgi:Bax protein
MSVFGSFRAPVGALLALAAMLTLATMDARAETDRLGAVATGVWEQSRLDYSLEKVRAGESAVPAVFATVLPARLRDIDDVDQRKRLFIRTVLPLVLESNERILLKRRHLMEIAQGLRRTEQDRAWLRELAHDYEVDPDSPDALATLLNRVDVIPPSLAIAQAITESGWGTSRFAQRGRALYGQRTWSQGKGIVPTKRRSGEQFEVKAFRSLLQSVTAYMRNLNTHPAYQDLRDARAIMRRSGQTIDGYVLAQGLTRYAETGEAYVDDLQMIIRVNDLRDFDDARIRDAGDRLAAL